MSQDEEKPNHLKEPEKQVTLKVNWDLSAEKSKTIYVNQLLISHASGEFYLIFGELEGHLFLNPDSKSIPEGLTVNNVVKLAITPENMIKFSEIIRANVEKYLESQKGKAKA